MLLVLKNVGIILVRISFAKIQLEILESVAPTLKQWGIMVYSTCTITPEENQEVVAAFLAKHPEFEKN